MTEKPKTVLHNDCLTAPEHISLGFGASRVSLRARKPTSPTDWQPTLKPAEMEDVLIMVLMLAEGCKAGLFRLFHFFYWQVRYCVFGQPQIETLPAWRHFKTYIYIYLNLYTIASIVILYVRDVSNNIYITLLPSFAQV